MKWYFWIIGIALVIIISLIISNKSNANNYYRRIEEKKREVEKLNKEILELKQTVESGAKKIEEEKQKTIEKEELYYRLMRTYMIARKKSETEVIDEIERSINEDYEFLGSKGISATTYVSSVMADFYTWQIKAAEENLRWLGQKVRSTKIADIRKDAAELIERAKKNQYAYEIALTRLINEHPDLGTEYIEKHYGLSLAEVETINQESTRIDKQKYEEKIQKYEQTLESYKRENREELKQQYEGKIVSFEKEILRLKTKCAVLEEKIDDFEKFRDIRWPLLRDSVLGYQKEFSSNLTAIPYMSRIIADIMTVDLDRLAWSLSWGNNQERKKKVANLNALKKEKSEEIERIKGAEYQLAYLLELYPALQDVIDSEFKDLEISYDQLEDYDPSRRFLEREEWEKLSETERNQLALDRYIESRRKSKWQIGRDYELFCGYNFEQKGYAVDYFGSYNGLEDLGRDLIVSKGEKIIIVQCKYWSKTKVIHENHVMQLYGSVIEYNLENKRNAKGLLITNTELSEKAKEFAKVLDISYKENIALGEFPRIKCNIGVGEFGERTKIYHLPFDQQYDVTKVNGADEFMAMSVLEAENAGFRRAYKWHGM